MAYVISTNHFTSSKKFGRIYIKGDYTKLGDNLLVLKGEVFHHDLKEIYNAIEVNGLRSIHQFKGCFSIVYCDFESGKLSIANDKSGRENLFYYLDEKNMIVSDDFWEIVNIVEPLESDICIQSLKESITFFRPLFYKTIIKKLNAIPPASIGIYDLDEKKFALNQYWDFIYIPDETLTIDDASDRLDQLFDKSMERLSNKFPDNTIFGLGLSGGLDSRLILKYAKKYDLNLVCFIVANVKPNKFWVSHDVKITRKLAKQYATDLKEINYTDESYDKKMYDDVRHNPTGSSNFFISAKDRVPSFDVLLNGTNGGETLGGLIPFDINKLNRDELCESIIGTFSYMNIPEERSVKTKVGIFINTIFNRSNIKPFRSKKRNSIDGIVSVDEFKIIKSKIQAYIKNNSEKKNLDIFQQYLFWHLISLNKYGMFDSLYGTKKSYGLYTDPYVFEESLKWKPDFLLDKKIQINYYNNFANDLGRIPAQNSKIPISLSHKDNIYNSSRYLISFMVRGKGLDYTSWAQKKSYKEYSRNVLLKKNELFNKNFDVRKVLQLTKYDMRMYEDIVKCKYILDLIDTKEYKEFFKD